MPNDVLVPSFYVKLNGAEVSPEFMASLEAIDVDLSVFLPGMATLRMIDTELKWVDENSLDVGAELEISVKPTVQIDGATPPPAVVIFKGRIASLEPQYDVDAQPAVMVIRAFDKLHGLHRGTGTKTFLQSKDSDMVQTIAREAGLRAQVTATTVKHEHVFRGDLSAYEFVQLLARRNGHATYCEGDTLHWKPLLDFNFPEVTLSYGDTLAEFRPVLSTAGQVNEVKVQGWDPKTKRVVTGTATSTQRLTETGAAPSGGPALAQSKFSSAKLHVSDHLTDTPLADALAKSVFSRMAAGDLTAEGRALGDPKIKPGAKMKIQGIGNRFAGSYLITRVHHQFDATTMYYTRFWLGGMSSGTVGSLLADNPTDPGSRSRIAQGVVVGIVTNNTDPDNVARVKVKFPWLSEQDESAWAPILGLGAGNQRGLLLVPEVNDAVLVAFANGDFNRPYVLGGVWNGQDAPPNTGAVDGGSVEIRELKTRVGHILRFTDKAGSEKIEIIDKTTKNSIVITASDNSITITADGPISLIAKQDVKIESSAKVDIKGTSEVKVSGPTITVEASAKLALKAPSVDINGSGTVKISGPMVQIN